MRATRARRARHVYPALPRRLLVLTALCGMLALCVTGMTGCAGALVGAPPPLHATVTSTAVPTATRPPSPTAPLGPTPVQIADLGAFRQQVAKAFSSNQWAQVNPLLSPNFSFQGTDSGGAQLLMPRAAQDLKTLFASEGPWTQGQTYEVTNHACFSGNTPTEQIVGFDGAGGSFVMVGLQRWQGYWVVTWAFQDPLGGYNRCASE